MLGTVHHLVIVLLGITQCILCQDVTHHVFEGRYHDVEEVKLISHPQRKVKVAEQLDRDVDDTVRKRVGVTRLDQHH